MKQHTRPCTESNKVKQCGFSTREKTTPTTHAVALISVFMSPYSTAIRVCVLIKGVQIYI